MNNYFTTNFLKHLFLFVFLFIANILKSQILTISPAETDLLCPGNFNEATFFISLTNIECDSVKYDQNECKNLTVQSFEQCYNNQNVIRVKIVFADQWTGQAILPIFSRKKANNGFKIKEFQFPYVRSLTQRNIFQYGIFYDNISTCPTVYHINFPKIQYVKLGGSADILSDRYGSVDYYEYQLPNGVTPQSGLTLVPGYTNNYYGTNDVYVNITDAFVSKTIKVRAFNAACSQPTQSGNWNDVILQRPTVSISGISSIKCGETDVKTFSITGVNNANCISSFTWQIANKGWKDINGNLITNNITTTAPNLQS